MRSATTSTILAGILFCYAQTTAAQTPTQNRPARADTASTADDGERAARETAAIHGAAGPFAVAGYRIGARAMRELGALKGGFGVDVLHEAPAEVQWSCVVDGLQAATGASLGKLNLRLTTAPADRVRSVVTDRESGARLVFRLKDSFLKRFFNVPVPDLEAAGREALKLSDDEIFSVEVAAEGTRKNPFRERRRAGATNGAVDAKPSPHR